MKQTYWKILRDAIVACVIFAMLGVVVNAVRREGLLLIADKPYDIFVPCPETLGTVEMILPDDFRLWESSSFIVDSRLPQEYDAWHFANAFCITYDYLEPIAPEELENITYNIANSGKARLIVYGDGDGMQGTTGYELGRELAGHGIKNVYIVKGGADALRGVSHE